MTNKEIYRKTIGFSVRRLLWDLLALLILAGSVVLGVYLDKKGIVGLAVGLIVGVVLMIVILRFVAYTYRAGQIAMMTKGVTEGELPEHVIAEGRKAVKERFATVAIYYAATRVIRSIFNQLGRGLTKLGSAVGGDAGETVGSAISTVINVIIAYLCDCCLGWVFFRREENAAKATLQGAALFFKHGKTFLKNMGRVFGLGLISLLVIGGALFGVIFAVLKAIPAMDQVFGGISNDLMSVLNQEETAKWLYDALTNHASLMIFAAAVGALLIWSFIHSNFVRPFVLVGVLRNYMQAGMNDMPTDESFAAVAKASPAFAKAMKKAA